MDWVSKGAFKGDLEMLDKSGNGVGKIHVAVKFERPGQQRSVETLRAGILEYRYPFRSIASRFFVFTGLLCPVIILGAASI